MKQKDVKKILADIITMICGLNFILRTIYFWFYNNFCKNIDHSGV